MAEEQRIIVDYIPGRDLVTIDFHDKETGEELHHLQLSASETHLLAELLEMAVRRVYAELI